MVLFISPSGFRGDPILVEGTAASLIARLVERAERINAAHAGTVTLNFSPDGVVRLELREVFSLPTVVTA